MARTISKNICQSPTRRLGKMATNRTIRAQRLAQFHDEVTPIQADHGIHPSRPPNQKLTKVTNTSRSYRTHATNQTTSSNRHSTRPRTHDQSEKYVTTLPPLLGRTEGLAQWKKSIDDTSYNQTGPKAIRPPKNFKGTIPRGVSADATYAMEAKRDPRCVPRQSADPVPRDRSPWSQSSRTTT